MVGPEIILRRVAKPKEHLQILGELAQILWEGFPHNPRICGSAERFLQLAIEATVDIGANLVLEMGRGPADTYRDIPRALEKAGVISGDLARNRERSIGFQVPEYVDFDRRRVCKFLTADLQDLRQLPRLLAQFL